MRFQKICGTCGTHLTRNYTLQVVLKVNGIDHPYFPMVGNEPDSSGKPLILFLFPMKLNPDGYLFQQKRIGSEYREKYNVVLFDDKNIFSVGASI